MIVRLSRHAAKLDNCPLRLTQPTYCVGCNHFCDTKWPSHVYFVIFKGGSLGIAQTGPKAQLPTTVSERNRTVMELKSKVVGISRWLCLLPIGSDQQPLTNSPPVMQLSPAHKWSDGVMSSRKKMGGLARPINRDVYLRPR